MFSIFHFLFKVYSFHSLSSFPSMMGAQQSVSSLSGDPWGTDRLSRSSGRKLSTVHFGLYNVHCEMYTVHSLWNTVHCILCSRYTIYLQQPHTLTISRYDWSTGWRQGWIFPKYQNNPCKHFFLLLFISLLTLNKKKPIHYPWVYIAPWNSQTVGGVRRGWPDL